MKITVFNYSIEDIKNMVTASDLMMKHDAEIAKQILEFMARVILSEPHYKNIETPNYRDPRTMGLPEELTEGSQP